MQRPACSAWCFGGLLPACLPAAWHSTRRRLHRGRLVAVLSGIGFGGYLVYTELFTPGAICLWCTAVYLRTLALFAAVAFGTALREPDPA